MARLMFELKDVRVRFGSTDVVKGISFTVTRGGCFGLVGESGSGKSTVLGVLSGLNPNWSGDLVVDGEPQGPRRHLAFFRRVQMVFQDPYASLHPRQTVEEALSEPLIVHRISGIDARIQKALREVSLPS